jgi:integrase
LERTLNRIENSKIDEKSRVEILKFLSECSAEGLSKPRMIKYALTLEQVAKILGKPFSKATKSNIVRLVKVIEGRDYSDWTKRDYKIVVKRFFKWLKKSEDYPDEVRWIKARVKNTSMLPEELLTEEEVKRMAEAANNQRDRAFILVLYESGCRIGEILSLKIKNVHFDDYGAVLIVNGKTGSRRVRVLFSQAELASWMNIHPLRGDPDAPLWVTLGTNSRNSILNYRTACEILKESAKKARIRKRIYPHLFRHSRATYLANYLTEAQMKQYFGWVQGSSMASVYVHLSGRDVDKALLKLQGINVPNEKIEQQLKVIICPRCKNKNSPTSKFCNACGLCLDMKTAMQVDEARAKADKLMTALIEQPEVLDMMIKVLEKIKRSEAYL